MSSGKKAQRTKGNTKPSSSSRSAKFLQHEGQAGHHAFSALAANAYCIAPQEKGDGVGIDGELRLLLRKMAKKDTVTKMKAVQEFTVSCKEKDSDTMKSILGFWPRLYNKLSHDYDHRVRESTQCAHYELVRKAGRNLAPYLKLIITNWLMSQFDTHTPAACQAKLSFDEVFPENKMKEVLSYCKMEILENSEKNILKETADTLSDPKVVSLEEREAKYNRFISSSFLLLKYYFNNILQEGDDDAIRNSVNNLFADKKFWKFAKHISPLIRSSFFRFLLTCFEQLTSLIEEYLSLASFSLLTNIDEQDLSVASSLWDALLCCFSKYENIWQHVNVRKAVWPKLWKLLKSTSYHNINIVYPNLLPFISNIPFEVADGIGFYKEFFNNLLEGLRTSQRILSESDKKLIIKTYMECLRYILINNDSDKELSNMIANDLLRTSLSEIFHSDGEKDNWHMVFVSEVYALIRFLDKEKNVNKSGCEYFKSLHNELWNVMSSVIFCRVEEDIEFVVTNLNFSELLIEFLSSSNTVISDDDSTILNQFNDNSLWIFVQCVLKCYILEVFGKKNYCFGEHLVKLISLTPNIELIKFACIEKLRFDEDLKELDPSCSNVDILKTFLSLIALPLLSAKTEFKKIVVDLSLDFMNMLHGDDKQDYLVAVFEKELFTADISLAILLKVFNYSEEKPILRWLKSNFVEKQIKKLCTAEMESDMAECLKWQTLRMYLHVVEENPEKQLLYISEVLNLMRNYFEPDRKSEKEVDDVVLATYISVCNHISDISNIFLETWLAIFIQYVRKSRNGDWIEAINGGFAKIIYFMEGEYISQIVLKLLSYLKANTLDDENCTRLCKALCSLLQFSEGRSKEISYGKKILDGIFTMVQELMEYQVDEQLKLSNLYSRFLKTISEVNSLLQVCSEDKLNNLILCCVSIGVAQKNEFALKDVKDCISNCDFIHFNLINKAINRCLEGKAGPDVVKTLLHILSDNGQLSELIIDHCLMISAPSKYEYSDLPCRTYCAIISIVDDISCIRALVELYTDELKNNENVKSNSEAFGGLIKVLCAVLLRWHTLVHRMSCDHTSLDDYNDVVLTVLDNILLWKEDHSDMMLFSCLLSHVNSSVVLLNMQVIHILAQLVDTSLMVFKPEHRDFLLCSMISWIQTCEDSLDNIDMNSLYSQFICKSFELFALIAYSYQNCVDSSISTISPCIYSKKISSSVLPSLSDDSISEWVEFFLPTVSTSLLRIFQKIMKSGTIKSTSGEFEKILFSCIQYVPFATLNEFAFDGCDENEKKKKKALEEFYTGLCQFLKDGEWESKISSYQLLARLVDPIENLLCVSIKEDEEHEGCRSFPSSLMEIMESSRDETLKILCGEGISIKEPLKNLHQPEGKKALFTYLLSWKLILQLFKAADSANRAMFANHLCKNDDIHDLITCLFCIMPQTDFEYKPKFSLISFAYSEIQHVAFDLLLTATESIPALIRKWFNNRISRVDAGVVSKFVSTFVSPILLKKEFQTLNESAKEFNNMLVKTRSTVREIAAIYTVDVVSMELVVELPADHPLSPVAVTCGKRIGVSNSLWRQWMLQLNTFLSFQNGSILDGLALWKRNVDKRFEGVEECIVCFSVLHGSNYSLPSIACKTCKKKFHPACLYKWFNTSGKSTCPLCRNIF